MKKYVYIQYFQYLLYLYFTSIENIEKNVKANVENIRGVKDIKVDRILKRRYIGKTSYYLGLSCISSKVFFVFLLRLSFISKTRL